MCKIWVAGGDGCYKVNLRTKEIRLIPTYSHLELKSTYLNLASSNKLIEIKQEVEISPDKFDPTSTNLAHLITTFDALTHFLL